MDDDMPRPRPTHPTPARSAAAVKLARWGAAHVKALLARGEATAEEYRRVRRGLADSEDFARRCGWEEGRSHA